MIWSRCLTLPKEIHQSRLILKLPVAQLAMNDESLPVKLISWPLKTYLAYSHHTGTGTRQVRGTGPTQ